MDAAKPKEGILFEVSESIAVSKSYFFVITEPLTSIFIAPTRYLEEAPISAIALEPAINLSEGTINLLLGRSSAKSE